jgi:magnesium transporter
MHNNGEVLIDAAWYKDGLRQPNSSDFKQLLEKANNEGGFVWLGLAEPSNEEFSEIAEIFGLHTLAVEDAVVAQQRPKLEDYGDQSFLVLKTVFFTDVTNDVTTGELMLFIGTNFIVIVRHGEGTPLTTVRTDLEHKSELLKLGPWAVVHAVIDRIIDEYTKIATQFDIAIAKLESQVFSDERTTYSEDIYFLKREIIEYRHAIEPLMLPLQRLTNGLQVTIPNQLIPYLRDVNDHLNKACDNSAGLDSLLNAVLQADLAHIQLRQNEDIRKISGWVALTATPTMIAGIYGMNFQHMPELGWQFGYPLILGLMGSFSGFVYYKLKKSGWL